MGWGLGWKRLARAFFMQRTAPSGDADAKAGVSVVPVLGLAVVIALGGCSSKDATPDDIYSGYEETVVVDEADLPGEIPEGTSLDMYRQGTLGEAGGQGPLDDVYFDFDAYSLSVEARELLDRNVEWLNANPTTRVEIEGHCDSRGTVEYNLGLGARRATAVRDYLVTAGVASDRMSTISYGKELPVCREETPDCWARNRRAHLVVLE
jgi:peptidoglycan-associated lipoprotein